MSPEAKSILTAKTRQTRRLAHADPEGIRLGASTATASLLASSAIDLRLFQHAPDDQLVDEHVTAALVAQKVATLRRHRWLGVGIPWVKLGASCRYRLGDIRADPRSQDS